MEEKRRCGDWDESRGWKCLGWNAVRWAEGLGCISCASFSKLGVWGEVGLSGKVGLHWESLVVWWIGG